MQSRPDELEAFKTEIDLVEYAADQGYAIDKRKTSRTSVSMRHEGNGDRILVALNSNGHYIYASVHDHTDNGTILDFCQKRGAGTLGHVRKLLRPWIGEDSVMRGRVRVSEAVARPVLEAVRTNFAAVQAAFAGFDPIQGESHYLTAIRGIPAAVYLHPRFVGRLRTDERGNVIFPHVQSGGELTGWEAKNVNWTGFAPNGAKRLFCSGFAKDDTRLVICEAGLDLLSYAALFGIEGGRFLSTGGALNPQQVALLRAAIGKMPEGSEVVLAVDADDGGDAIAEVVESIHGAVGAASTAFRRHSPPTRGQDWNDVLCEGGMPDSPPPLPS